MQNKQTLQAITQSLTEVFGLPRYAVFALLLSLVAFAAFLWLQNLQLLIRVASSSLFAFPDKILFSLRLLGGITTSVRPGAAVLIVVMACLFGVNAALLTYSLRHRRSTLIARTKGGTVVAVISAIFGVGCASCGTYLLGAVLASVGASSLLSFLPLGGREFLILSILLLLLSIIWTAKSMTTPAVCTVPNTYGSK